MHSVLVCNSSEMAVNGVCRSKGAVNDRVVLEQSVSWLPKEFSDIFLDLSSFTLPYPAPHMPELSQCGALGNA